MKNTKEYNVNAKEKTSTLVDLRSMKMMREKYKARRDSNNPSGPNKFDRIIDFYKRRKDNNNNNPSGPIKHGLDYRRLQTKNGQQQP